MSGLASKACCTTCLGGATGRTRLLESGKSLTRLQSREMQLGFACTTAGASDATSWPCTTNRRFPSNAGSPPVIQVKPAMTPPVQVSPEGVRPVSKRKKPAVRAPSPELGLVEEDPLHTQQETAQPRRAPPAPSTDAEASSSEEDELVSLSVKKVTVVSFLADSVADRPSLHSSRSRSTCGRGKRGRLSSTT
ncbi:hypothetical protein BCR35DRAFT_167765 [Leucosporidium creatinivorum]|uniref:Uncharacterized protein n=1 Tax=Leucosporidium creatinivorum TaxID=106004 RepID=A0A1Y2ECW5_9BASI|nr:hypothetical protein BCR35DRAFT_167765 [Leucosporidium creatinivorum]